MYCNDIKNKDDNELLELALQGSDTAFTVLALRHRSMIYQVVYKYIGEPSECEDVCQEVLMKILAKGHLFENRASFKSWLFRLTVNVSLNYLRTLKRINTNQEEYVLDQNDSNKPEDYIQAERTKKRIHDCLDTLPDKQKEALTLKLYADLKLEEIAGAIGVTLSTIKTNVSLASKKFVDCMEQFR